MKNINYIGMDVHKEKMVIAEARKNGEAEIIGEFNNNDSGIKKMVKIFKEKNKEEEVQICYEAGPCGYAIKRILDKEGLNCQIVAPSLIPVKVGNRIKTDKRDAKKIARYFRAGELTFIHVPNEEKEAVRDLVRCRQSILETARRIKQEISHFLLRHALVYSGKCTWTVSHRTWLNSLKLEEIQQITKEQYVNTLTLVEIQLKEITQKIEEVAMSKEYKDKVAALCGYRGISTLTAMVIISEIVDFRRFSNAKELMCYLGLVPSEYSSGGKETKGSITKCGNKHVRRALIESSWHYALKPTITKKMEKKLGDIPNEQRIAPIKALKRLSKRFYHLVLKGKPRQKAIVAVARELSGFLWHSMVELENKLESRDIFEQKTVMQLVPQLQSEIASDRDILFKYQSG